MKNQEQENETSVLKASSIISYEIIEDEKFMRMFKRPYDTNKKGVLKPYQSFVPAIQKSSANSLDGVSMDRMRYLTPLEAKKVAVNNLSQAAGNASFAGFLILTIEAIKSVNSMTIEELTGGSIKNEEEFKKAVVSTTPELTQMLAGFDVSQLLTCAYCGVLATPMTRTVRIPPDTVDFVESDVNFSHAEVFYLWKGNDPNEPRNTFVNELARHLTEKAEKHYDSDPNNLDHSPLS
jgi:hypothetical protein